MRIIFLTAFCALLFHGLQSQQLTQVFLKDPFDDNRFAWFANKGDSTEYEVAGGKYIITNRSVRGWSSLRSLYFNRSVPHSVSASAAWYSGVNGSGYGIVMNRSDDGTRSIEFLVSGNGYYLVTADTGSSVIRVSNGWQKSPLVKTGSGNANILRIEITGDTYSFYLNETAVQTVTIPKFKRGNRIGLIVYNKQQVLFDDFEAKQWSVDNTVPGKITGKTSSFAGPVSAKPVPSKRGGMEVYYYQDPATKTDKAATDEDEDDWDDEDWDDASKIKSHAGLKDKDGYRLLDPVYRSIYDSREGRVFAAVSDTSYAVLDDKLNRLTPFVFDYSGYYENGYAIVSIGRLYGMIDKEGKTVLPFIYGYLTKPDNGILYAELGDKAGIIKLNGEEVVPFGKINKARTYNGLVNGMMASIDESGKTYGIRDKTGKWVVEPIYKYMSSYRDGYYVFGIANPAAPAGNLYGVMDKNAKIIVQPVYGRISLFQNNMVLGNDAAGKTSTDFREKMKIRYALADKTGKLLTEMKYLRIAALSDTAEYFTAVAEIKTDPANRFGKVGLLDKKGKEVVPCIYDSRVSMDASMYGDNVSEYADRLINVQKDGKFGYVDHTGKTVIPFLFTSANSFKNGAAWVTKDGKSIYIDKTGKELPAGQTGSYAETVYALPPIRK